MHANKVIISGVDTSKLKVLKEEEKMKYLQEVKQGNQDARQKLICGNLKLVLSVIQRFTNRGENLDDLFQVGCIGLIKAIDNFDTKYDVKFSTYCVPMIIGEVRRFLRDSSNSIKVSRSFKDIAYKAMHVKESLTKTLNRDPTIEEIAKELQMNKADVVLALEAIVEPVSLYEPIYSDGGDTIYVMDQVGDRSDDNDWMEEILFKQALAGLNPREKKILMLRFYQGKTQVEVAKEIGISQAQVSRLEKAALHRIKEQI